MAADAILLAEGVERKEQVSAWVAEKQASAYAMNLPQIDNDIIVPPSGWKCAKCDKTDNLWLNLTDGMILCGRKNWDGTGGNNHAIDHYNETKYPLAVKLGTITADLEAAGSIAFVCNVSLTIVFLMALPSILSCPFCHVRVASLSKKYSRLLCLRFLMLFFVYHFVFHIIIGVYDAWVCYIYV